MFRKRGHRLGYSQKKRFGVRTLILVLIVLIIGFFIYNKYIDINLNKANTFLARNNPGKAETYFSRVARFPFSKGRGEDGLGVLDLLRGNNEAAKAHFKVVLEHKPRGFGGHPQLVFDMFIERGSYENARIYRDFLRNWKSADNLSAYALDFAATSLGVRELSEAREFLDGIQDDLKESERFRNLSNLLEEYEEAGTIPVLVDRRGTPILAYHIESGREAFKSPKLFEGWEDRERDFLVPDKADRLNRIHTTLDLNLQKSAYQAMRGYKGAMLLSDPSTGEILAAYGTSGHPPLSTSFEPGSVIKILTYATYLSEGGEVSNFAPKTYPGNMSIGGRIFYDWTTHGFLESVNEGMAVSCNLMFAQMGNDLGWSKLNRGFRRLYDGKPQPGYLGDATFGKLIAEPEGAWELGRAAIGLDFLNTTVLGLVLIPSAVANGGKLVKPSLILQYANIEGHIYKQSPKPPEEDLFSKHIADELREAMASSVTIKKGTARRARVDFVQTALKTGTAGERPFDSIVIGFFPVEQPKVALAFYLDKGGKCEINGARVVKRLMEQVKALAPEYLEQ